MALVSVNKMGLWDAAGGRGGGGRRRRRRWNEGRRDENTSEIFHDEACGGLELALFLAL